LNGVVGISCATRCLIVFALLAAGCGGGADHGVQIEVVNEGMSAPAITHLTFDWLAGEQFLIRDRRVPAEGVLDLTASPLAKIRIQAGPGVEGIRRVVVRGMVENNVVSEGTGSGTIVAGRWEVISVGLLAGRRPDRDGDGVPDAVDGCPGDPLHVDVCGAADGGVPDVGGGDTGAADEPPGTAPETGGDTGEVLADASADGPSDGRVEPDATQDVRQDAGTGEVEPPPTFACGNALLVVGVANNPGDNAMAARLKLMGCTVTTLDDTAVVAADATGKSLAVISESAAPSQVKVKLKAVTAGVVNMQHNLLDEFGFTKNVQGTDWDLTPAATTGTIVDALHPMAAKLSGTLPLFTAAAAAAWGAPDAPAIRIAALDAPAHLLLFGFDTGAPMSLGFVAPGRRVALLLSRDAVIKLNANGWALFDAAARWTSGH
jgi:hypothetical protein